MSNEPVTLKVKAKRSLADYITEGVIYEVNLNEEDYSFYDITCDNGITCVLAVTFFEIKE